MGLCGVFDPSLAITRARDMRQESFGKSIDHFFHFGRRHIWLGAADALIRLNIAKLFKTLQRGAHHAVSATRNLYDVFGHGSSASGEPHFAGKLLDARKRLDAALAYVGPGLADVAIAICCAEVGLEDYERGFELPKRSGKLMLKMALMRLSVHYGLQSTAATASFRMR